MEPTLNTVVAQLLSQITQLRFAHSPKLPSANKLQDCTTCEHKNVQHLEIAKATTTDTQGIKQRQIIRDQQPLWKIDIT